MRPLRIISGKEIDRGILPYPKSPIAEKIWEIISEKHEFAPLSQESLVNLGIANELLKKEAIIVYLNHSSEDDASVAIALALSHLTNAVRFMGPAGMKHYDLKRDKKNGILLRSLRLLNIHVIPVVQHDDLDNYSESKRNRMLKRLKKKSKSLLSKKGGIYGISPEGTRNQEDFKLLPARPGIGKVGKYAPKNICYLPIAIVYKNQSDKPEIVVGNPETVNSLANRLNATLPKNEDQRAQKIADLLMYKLSLLLPKNIRGAYSNFKVK